MNRFDILKDINIMLDNLDQLVKDGVLTRRELTDIILRRHVLAMKYVLRYAEKNLNCKIIHDKIS